MYLTFTMASLHIFPTSFAKKRRRISSEGHLNGDLDILSISVLCPLEELQSW